LFEEKDGVVRPLEEMLGKLYSRICETEFIVIEQSQILSKIAEGVHIHGAPVGDSNCDSITVV